MIGFTTHTFICPKCNGETAADHETICTAPNLLCDGCGHDLTDQMAVRLASIPDDERYTSL